MFNFQDTVLSSTLEVESFKIKCQPLATATFLSVTIFITQQTLTNVMFILKKKLLLRYTCVYLVKVPFNREHAC